MFFFQIKPVIQDQFRMDKVPEAFQKLQDTGSRGKIVIDMKQDEFWLDVISYIYNAYNIVMFDNKNSRMLISETNFVKLVGFSVNTYSMSNAYVIAK